MLALLGFDASSPSLRDELVAAGRLPTLAGLLARGQEPRAIPGRVLAQPAQAEVDRRSQPGGPVVVRVSLPCLAEQPESLAVRPGRGLKVGPSFQAGDQYVTVGEFDQKSRVVGVHAVKTREPVAGGLGQFQCPVGLADLMEDADGIPWDDLLP